MSPTLQLLLAVLAAALAGAVNAIAGGGSLITFPMLLFVGVPPVLANATNTVALCPGYFSATYAQRQELAGQGRRLWLIVPAGVVGGIGGAALLLGTRDQTFRLIVPFLILLAALLFAFQGWLRKWFAPSSEIGDKGGAGGEVALVLGVAALGVYGGYFGAGLGVMLLAVLGLLLQETLARLNALKQVFSLVVNLAAATFFIARGQVEWRFAVVMAAGALLGGAIGGRIASRANPTILRYAIVVAGLTISIACFIKL